MSVNEVELSKAYAEWRRLAEAEGNAIRSGNWEMVADCQRAITRLRTEINRLSTQNSTELDPTTKAERERKQTRRAIILELMELQRRNLSSIEQRRRRLSEHIEALARAERNLRGIQRSYATPSLPAFSSYS